MSSRASGKLEATEVVTVAKSELRRLFIFGAEGAHVDCDEAGLVFLKNLLQARDTPEIRAARVLNAEGDSVLPACVQKSDDGIEQFVSDLDPMSFSGGQVGESERALHTPDGS